MSALFRDRLEAGRRLADVLESTPLDDAVVVGLARGGVPVAAEIARRLSLPLDALAIRKIGHPWQPEYGIGAVTPGSDGIYVRARDGLRKSELRQVVERARREADELDRVLHRHHSQLDLRDKTVLLVDDGLATGATMIAAIRWARARGAVHVVVAVPVGAAESIASLREEADDVLCPYEQETFWAVAYWYEVFTQVSSDEVVALLDERTRDLQRSSESPA